MAFVKLDTGVLDSTLWIDRPCRELFITALLMAEPIELAEPIYQYEVRAITKTGFEVPPGWYGFVRAAGVGIVNRALMDQETGLAALERLGSPDQESRSKEHEGRRLVRVDGGFVVLNYFKYRDRDHTAAERQRRLRERKRNAVTLRDTTVTSHIADADADADAESENKSAAVVATDPKKALWELGVSVLGNRSRAIIGKQIKLAGETKVASVLAEMAISAKADPVPYFLAATTPERADAVARAARMVIP